MDAFLEDGGHAPRNTVPSRGRTDTRLLSAGCDSLYWSAKGELSVLFNTLRAERDAASRGADTAVRVINGFSLEVLSHGAYRYPVVLDCFEFRVHITDSGHLPTTYVELRSTYINEVGLGTAFEESLAAVRTLVASLGEPRVSRLDLFADYAGFELSHADYPGFVTHAKRRTIASDAESYETVQFGKTPLLVRIYRKDIERRQRGELPLPSWNGEAGPVTRVEVQASSDFLRTLGIRTFAEVAASRGDIWRHGTREFVRFSEVGPGERKRWPLRSEWLAVQQTGIDAFPSSGVLPHLITQGDRIRVLRLLHGCLSSLGAHENLDEVGAVLGRLPKLLPLVARERSFAADVRKKRSRLPRAVLRGNAPTEAGVEL